MFRDKHISEMKDLISLSENRHVMDRYRERLISWKDEVLSEIFSSVSDAEGIRPILESFYTSLLEGTVEKFWQGAYERGKERIRKGLDEGKNFLILATLLSSLTARIVQNLPKEDAVAVVSYIIKAAVLSLYFTMKAYRDAEHEFAGFSDELMRRVRELELSE